MTDESLRDVTSFDTLIDAYGIISSGTLSKKEIEKKLKKKEKRKYGRKEETNKRSS